MKKNVIKGFFIIALLCSCVNKNSSTSDSSKESSNVNSSDVSSELLSEVSSEVSSSDNGIDYSKFDTKLIGEWYVHSSWMGILEINTPIIIKETYKVQILNVEFSYVGVYENFEGACLFENANGTMKFIASSDEEGVLDWGIFDSNGNQDIGVARTEKYVSGIQYSYEGKDWPINEIKEFMGTTEDLPIYEHNYYYLFTGISQVYDDAKYCMIDLYGVSDSARKDYANLLENNGYVIDRTSVTFYQGYNESKIYGIKISQTDDNMCIFIYYYETLYKVEIE